MKQNVTLSSTDRELFGITIRQNTKESFLSVSDLQKAYEKARWVYGWSERGVNSIMQSNDFRERIFHLLNERGLIKVSILTFMEMVKNEGVTKVLKGLGLYKTTGRGENKTVMADPYVWVLLAMEMNPMLYAKVIIWLTDTLIFDRIEAGSEYMPMNSKIKEITSTPDYPKYAKLINQKVFGQHKSGMRNLASAKELKAIADLEKTIITAIDNKWINNEKQLIDFLSK
jgi:hypothetical protein